MPRDGPDIPFADMDRLRRRKRLWRWLERLLMVVGVLCLGYVLYVYSEARLYQALEDRELDAILSSRSNAPVGVPSPKGTTMLPRPAPGSLVGRIEIPRLGVSAIIRAGSDASTLKLAVGYIPGTALPGENGNVGLAGHRDTFFRKLRNIGPEDEIRVTTRNGVFNYVVQRTNIVNPKDVWVLNPTTQPVLTLVTCYPFYYVGSAPQRFIVRATLASSKPAG